MKKTTLFVFVLAFILFSTSTRVEAQTGSALEQLIDLADSLHSAGRTDSAAIVGADAVRLAEKIGSPSQRIVAYSSQGVYLRSLGRMDDALKSYESGLEIATSDAFRNNPDTEAIEEIASLYINLAVLNLDMQQKDEAIRNAEFSAGWIAKSDDAPLKSTIFGVVGSVLMAGGAYEKAAHYQDLAYSNAIEAHNGDAAFRAAVYTMLLSDRLGNKRDVAAWRQKCVALFPEITSMMSKLAYYQAECSICLKNDDKAGALEWFGKLLALEGIDNLPFVKLDCYGNMHTTYADLGNFEKAYSTLIVYNELRDSIMASDKEESLRELTIKYETKETQLALAQSEARRARTMMWLFAALGVLLAGAVVFVVYVGRQRRRRMRKEMEYARLKADTARQLTQQYIEGLENERRRMAGELHDGVCNDLMAIRMSIDAGKSSGETARMIENCRESVRRISHELMPPEFSYASLDEVVRFFIAKQVQANAGKIHISYTSEAPSPAHWQNIPDATALEIYRIIQEAVGNAVKHSGADTVRVLLKLEGTRLEASVVDNGHYNSSGKKGLGLESIRRRANSIGGSATILHPEDGGTKVLLTAEIYGNP
ncbi:MAG: hypothetical protein K2M06_08230 [Muribaculaceae bacterium]|nr:hypothetical protein [Muribaculaceae bacterium]